jgi:hypothetical protein
MAKKKLKYETIECDSRDRIRQGRIFREHLSVDMIIAMLKEFFESHRYVKKLTFDDLKATYEIREESPLDIYRQTGFLYSMFSLYKLAYQIQNIHDPLVNNHHFHLKKFLIQLIENKLKLKGNTSFDRMEKLWQKFLRKKIRFPEFLSGGYKILGKGFLLEMHPLSEFYK